MIFNFEQAETPPQAGGLIPLSELAPGQAAIVDHLELPSAAADPLLHLGFLAGTEITTLRSAPGGDPVIYRIEGTSVALRRETARQILIQRLDEAAGALV